MARNKGSLMEGVQSTTNGSIELLKKIRSSNTAFQIHKLRKYCRTFREFTDIVAPKTIDSYCHFLSRQRKENFWEHAFSC